MNRDTPHPMPVNMRTPVEMKLGDREMSALDDNARFIVRRLVSDAYAQGFQDGYWQHAAEHTTDRQVAADYPTKGTTDADVG